MNTAIEIKRFKRELKGGVMPFCPQCRYEYDSDIQECPDCHKLLVPVLPSEPTLEEMDLVGLRSVPGLVYAEMVKEALEKAGIQCIIKSDLLTSGYLSKGANAVGDNSQIFVKKKDKKRAENILVSIVDHI
jgi:hypothetical protein